MENTLSKKYHDPEISPMDLASGASIDCLVQKLELKDVGERELKKMLFKAFSEVKSSTQRNDDIRLPALPKCREFVRAFGDALMVSESEFKIHHSLSDVGDRLKRGENIVVAANHVAPADTLALNKTLEGLGVGDEAVYLATKVPGIDLFHYVMLRGFNVHQVYSFHRFNNLDADKSQMQRYNRRSISEMIKLSREGSQLLVFFPQGTYEPHGLTTPPKSSSEIFEVFRRHSPHGFSIMPFSIDGTECILSNMEELKNPNSRVNTANVTVTAHELTKDTDMDNLMRTIALGLPEDKRKIYA